MQGSGERYGLAGMDFEYVPSSPGSRWAGESAARRRQRRLSSPSLRAYLTPAFDAVAAAGDGGVAGYSSSSSSGGLDLGFDASLLRYRRACFSAATDLDSRLLLYSPQSAPPQPPPQVRVAYPAAEDGVWAAGGGRYGTKRETGWVTGTPSFQESENCIPFISPRKTSANLPSIARGASTSIKLPADLQLPEANVVATNTELSTPEPGATTSTHKTAAELEPTLEDDDRITEALYGHSGHRRLRVFRDICPE